MTKNTENKGIRIAKAIAASGRCSRREAEEMIFDGRVKVNGQTIDSPALFITDQSIKIDNKLLNTSKQIDQIFIFNKPSGYLTTNNDPKGRKIIFDILPPDLPRLVTVGRLDFNTEGLLLLTTNGKIARYMELPKNAWIRKYKARVFGRIDNSRLKNLENGVKIDGVYYKSIKVKVLEDKNSSKEDGKSQTSANSWLEISLIEGKNREIRKVMESLGLQVNRLIRVSFGPFSIGNLKTGEIRPVENKVLKATIPLEKL